MCLRDLNKGTTGRATVVEEPKFHFETPKFKTKINYQRHQKILVQMDT
jgi:hypothetical protein